MFEGETYAFLIFTEHGCKRGIVSRLHSTVDTLGTLRTVTWTHHYGTQGRTQGQRTNHGNTNRSSHGDTKLGIENPRSTAHESNRNKHRHKHNGTSDNRHSHITHRILGSQVRRFIAGVELLLYGFHHHNGIVNYRTDSKHQRKQRQDIDGEPGSSQTCEGTHQRYNN